MAVLFARVMATCLVFVLLAGPTQAQSDETKAEAVKPLAPEVGKVAPEIEAEDVFGATFKLSDYRGKVVVLDFWGDW